LTVYFVTRLYDYKNPDEERKPWNDPKIIPVEINGNKNDPRVNKPWDWFYPPHK
jgi:dTDP-4-dehydrorhamnose 3,5-epimerase